MPTRSRIQSINYYFFFFLPPSKRLLVSIQRDTTVISSSSSSCSRFLGSISPIHGWMADLVSTSVEISNLRSSCRMHRILGFLFIFSSITVTIIRSKDISSASPTAKIYQFSFTGHRYIYISRLPFFHKSFFLWSSSDRRAFDHSIAWKNVEDRHWKENVENS